MKHSSTHKANSQLGHRHLVSCLSSHNIPSCGFLFPFCSRILLGKCCFVSLATVVLSAWSPVVFHSLEYFTIKLCTTPTLNFKQSTVLSQIFLYIAISFNTVTFSSLLIIFIQHLFIFFLSMRYLCNSWSFLSLPPINILFSISLSAF